MIYSDLRRQCRSSSMAMAVLECMVGDERLASPHAEPPFLYDALVGDRCGKFMATLGYDAMSWYLLVPIVTGI